MQTGLGLWSQTIHIYLNKIVIGPIQFMVMFRKSYLKIYQIHLAKVSPLLQQWMQTSIIA